MVGRCTVVLLKGKIDGEKPEQTRREEKRRLQGQAAGRQAQGRQHQEEVAAAALRAADSRRRILICAHCEPQKYFVQSKILVLLFGRGEMSNNYNKGTRR